MASESTAAEAERSFSVGHVGDLQWHRQPRKHLPDADAELDPLLNRRISLHERPSQSEMPLQIQGWMISDDDDDDDDDEG